MTLKRRRCKLRRSGTDRKWNELLRLLQDTPEMRDPVRGQRKLVIFTEHRDTLTYLAGTPDNAHWTHRADCLHSWRHAVEMTRRTVEDQFRNNPDVFILLATDAAGEGINLQRAHLMVNYDLPWNPNRLEQRFGRIHRIGQTEVCHLWNLVAGETREGAVYQRLLKKLEAERSALDGQVFDVLGKLFQETPLRKLLVEAVRYGDDPDVRARLEQAVDNALDRERVRDLLEQRVIGANEHGHQRRSCVSAKIWNAPLPAACSRYYIKAFFLQAFEYSRRHTP